MKLPVATALLILALVTSAIAAKPHKHSGKPAQQTPPSAAPAEPQAVSARLAQFNAAHLDAILGPIGQQSPLPRTELTRLRAAFTGESAKAPEAEREPFTAAIAVCNALNSAMDEREQTAASIASSAAVHGPSDLGARSKNVPRRGTRGDARLARIEKREERHEEANRKKEAAQKDDLLTQQHKNNWTLRSQQLRQQIEILTTRQSQAERAAQQPEAATPAPQRSTTPR